MQIAVMNEPKRDLEVKELPTQSDWVKVLFCTICRSDLHAWTGRRKMQTPVVLGHEIVGLQEDGKRVTWTIKDGSGRKYGHGDGMCGGFGTHCVITKGTIMYDIPSNLTNEEAAPANCAVATAVAAREAANLTRHDRVVVIGGGALGLYSVALAKDRGCEKIAVIMRNRYPKIREERFKLLKEFGAITDAPTDADVVFGTAGNSHDLPLALDTLKPGGRYIEMGCVLPCDVWFDISKLVSKRITIKGVHNYEPHHLHQAVAFLSHAKTEFPFHKIVGRTFSLDHINDALKLAETGEFVRVGIKP